MKRKIMATQSVRMTRTRAWTKAENQVKKTAPIMTGTTNRPRRYAMEMSRYCYCLIRMVFETWLRMEVDICHSKGQQRRLKRLVTYLFLIAGPPQAYKIQEDLVQSEVEDLIFDLILLVIVFALDDDAFEADIKSVE